MNGKLPAIVAAAALVICVGSRAQTPSPPEPGAGATPGQSNAARTDPSTATPSSVSDDPDMSSAAERRPKVGREARVGGISAGSIVQSPAGEAIGRVKDFVPNANTGEPAYVVIATRSGSTAVPYGVIGPLFQNGHVVLDRSKLEGAPRISETQLRDKTGAWMKEADRYWDSRNPPNLR